MRYNNNLYLVNKYVRLKFANYVGYSLGKVGHLSMDTKRNLAYPSNPFSYHYE